MSKFTAEDNNVQCCAKMLRSHPFNGSMQLTFQISDGVGLMIQEYNEKLRKLSIHVVLSMSMFSLQQSHTRTNRGKLGK